jgi:hypothetical protein
VQRPPRATRFLRVAAVALGVALVVSAPRCAWAQPLRLGVWDGAIEGVGDFAQQQITVSGSRSTLESTRFQEQLTLRNSGISVYDPRLLSLTVGGTFGLAQEDVLVDRQEFSRDGTVYGYDGVANVLSGRPYSLMLFANRNQTFLTRELAGRTETTTENRGLTLFARRLYVPSSLTFRQELLQDQSRTAGIVSRRDERRNIVTFEGQRGWVDTEADLRYEFVENTDDVLSELSFRSHEGSASWSRDFGSELNWRWDSRTRYFTRSGLAGLTLLTVDQLLRADHTERLSSEYRYFLARTEIAGGATTTHTGSASLRHRLYESLVTAPGLDVIVQTLPDGQKETLRGRLDLAYTKRLPKGGRLAIGLGGTSLYEDQRFNRAETFIPQESHTATTPFALPIALNNPFVVPDSVTVTKVAVGLLPAGCVPPSAPPLPLVLGRDFTLRTVGNVTEIVPLPCAGATPGINPGDVIAVDYRFGVPRSLTFTSTTWRADVSIDYGWVRPFFIHEQTDQSLLSGADDRFLNDERSDTAGIEFRYEGGPMRASALGEVRRYVSDRVVYDAVRSSQFVAIAVLRGMTLSLNADESLLSFQKPSRETRTLSGRATLTYAFDAALLAEAFGEVRALNDTLLPAEVTSEGGVSARWFYRKLEVSPAFSYIQRDRGDVESREYRATIRTIRRF